MPSHASHIDPVITFDLLGVPTSFIAKKELFKIPIFSQALKHGRVIPIDRTNLANAIESLKIAQKYANNGRSIVIAPEGTRRRKRSFEDQPNIFEFKKGPFHLVKNTGLKIVPIIYVGANRLWSPGRLGVAQGNVYVKVCEPIPFEKIKGLSMEEMMQLVRDTMIENSHPRADNEIFIENRWTALWIIGFWVCVLWSFKIFKNLMNCWL